jgi:hypothetical protein
MSRCGIDGGKAATRGRMQHSREVAMYFVISESELHPEKGNTFAQLLSISEKIPLRGRDALRAPGAVRLLA